MDFEILLYMNTDTLWNKILQEVSEQW